MWNRLGSDIKSVNTTALFWPYEKVNFEMEFYHFYFVSNDLGYRNRI